MEKGLSAISAPQLVAEITTLAGHLNAANARFLALVAELDRSRGWAERGVKSCAQGLNWKWTASHVEEVVRGYRRALDAAELTREALQQRDQARWYHSEPDGSLVIRVRFPAEVGALFVRALQAAEDSLPVPKNVSAEGIPPSAETHSP